MNNKIIIKVSGNINRFIDKCIKYKINISNVEYIEKDKITCKIDIKDYKSIVKLNYYSHISIIKYEGFNGIKKHIITNSYYYILMLFIFIVMDILTSYIIDIEVIHENKTIRNLVYSELKDRGIDKYTLSLSYDSLESIKKDILNNNPNKLEWMSITRVGMKYIVRVEERIINEIKEENRPCDIIASKDAYITKVISSKGEVKVRSGDYVKKGDILISGNIYLYDEVKGTTSARGTVYGDVWYEVQISIPKEKEIISDTGKSRYNFNINNKILFKNKYRYFRQDNIRELNILGFKIKIYKEIEYTKNNHKLSDEELNIELNNNIKESFKNKLKENGKIIKQKVLKKSENNSTIDYRVFVITNEIISKYLFLE